jgi:ribonuclease R
MPEPLTDTILRFISSSSYRPLRPRKLAHAMGLQSEPHYPSFRDALRELLRSGQACTGKQGTIVAAGSASRSPAARPSSRASAPAPVGSDGVIGTYRHNRRGFGFVVPTGGHDDLFIPEGENLGALSGDTVRARVTSRTQRDGRMLFTGRVTEIVERSAKRFVGSLQKQDGQWVVLPDGNALTTPIQVPDAGSRHVRPGTKVVVELTSYPDARTLATGVITEVLGGAAEKDVDLRGVIIQYNLPEEFPDDVLRQASQEVERFDPLIASRGRLDLSDTTILTIDPDDAKDYDDAISLSRHDDGTWELGVHIADVSHFVRAGTPLDEEAGRRGNSTYFPGFVIPMLPEVLSNGVCSLQEGVPRLTKSVFITLDPDGRPVSTRFANSVIRSAVRLRYTEAQDLIDGLQKIRHPDGPRSPRQYSPEVLQLLRDMNELARIIQKRRHDAGQLVLELPETELILDEDGKVIGAEPEDTSFTHTIIEMFMVEANEAVARLLDSIGVPFLRRIHPEPETGESDRLRRLVQASGHRLPKEMDRKSLQAVLERVKGRPESFAVNMAVLRSLTRAEYSPKNVGHYALASEQYAHFTSPIRRYADLLIHRLLDGYFDAAGITDHSRPVRPRGGRRGGKLVLDDAPDYESLVEIGRHISFTERRSEEAERELRKLKILMLLQDHVGEEFPGVVTGVANHGIYVQLNRWLVDGLIRYEDLLNDWWDVNESAGYAKGQRSGMKIGVGDVVRAVIVKVDLARRELDLAVRGVQRRAGHREADVRPDKPARRGRERNKAASRSRHPRDIQKKDRQRRRR